MSAPRLLPEWFGYRVAMRVAVEVLRRKGHRFTVAQKLRAADLLEARCEQERQAATNTSRKRRAAIREKLARKEER